MACPGWWPCFASHGISLHARFLSTFHHQLTVKSLKAGTWSDFLLLTDASAWHSNKSLICSTTWEKKPACTYQPTVVCPSLSLHSCLPSLATRMGKISARQTELLFLPQAPLTPASSQGRLNCSSCHPCCQNIPTAFLHLGVSAKPERNFSYEKQNRSQRESSEG